MVTGRDVLFANPDLAVCRVAATTTSGLYRDALGDELVYVQSGAAVLESVFGNLAVSDGDYVVIPRSTTHRWVIPDGQMLHALVLEAVGHVSVPEKYLTGRGQLREGAPFSERDLRVPEEPIGVPPEGPVAVTVRTRSGWSRHCHVDHPFDVDSDEVLFYSAGDFMSRRGAGIAAASITLHPAGFVHGPQPGSVEASVQASRTEETAVMIDRFAPLEISSSAQAAADPDYPWSWARRP